VHEQEWFAGSGAVPDKSKRHREHAMCPAGDRTGRGARVTVSHLPDDEPQAGSRPGLSHDAVRTWTGAAWSWGGAGGFDEAVLVGQGDQLCAVAGAEFGHGAADVGLGGGVADGEGGGDVGVAQAVRDESDDLPFSRGELGQGGRVEPWGGLIGQTGDQPAGQSRGEEGLAAGDDVDSVQELAGFGVLDQEAGGAGAECFDDVLVVIEGW
jgi:hypothetical protein